MNHTNIEESSVSLFFPCFVVCVVGPGLLHDSHVHVS